ncbi:YXWGXW repeat-containing protein [Mangrovitalea sediminis]|uniref:YXWGXW repeat-containing protein n=1 Tax=Mangrovitalea sediminis TaxID=1982043 RepID=UPI000BE4C0D5|nr:YXWGXW repeat-containing protein [Mangrovitalea sediminis]
MKTSILGAVLALSLTGLSGCTIGPAYPYPGYVTVAPPPARIVVRPPQPSIEFVWIDGYWSRQYNNWVWHDGHWARPPQGHSRWAPGVWRHERHGWVWVPGRWH